MKRNCVHIYYGYGKGKSTAAAGLAVRAIGAGKRVLAVYFLKDGSSSETAVLRSLGAHILFSENCKGFYSFMTPEEQTCCRKNQLSLLNEAIKIAADFDVIIFDEFLDLADAGILSTAKCEDVIAKLDCELIITGHKTWDGLADTADYVTHFDCKKHPYGCKNLAPRRGIEF